MLSSVYAGQGTAWPARHSAHAAMRHSCRVSVGICENMLLRALDSCLVCVRIWKLRLNRTHFAEGVNGTGVKILRD